MLADYDDLLVGLTPRQHDRVAMELRRHERDRGMALVLTIFLGWLGAHHFYLRERVLGTLYLVFCWTLIPLVVTFVELFFVMGRTDDLNRATARDLIEHAKRLT